MDTPAVSRIFCGLAEFAFLTATAWAKKPDLIVVEDRGGDSALPYYQRLRNSNRIPAGASRQIAPPTQSTIYQPSVRTTPQVEAAKPLRTLVQLQPGTPMRKSVPGPSGAKPFFLIGDEPVSRAWLKDWHGALLEAQAIGFVVGEPQAAESLRQLAPGIQLMPATGEEFAACFGIKTYPVLVVPTGWQGLAERP
jgi:integrating conjugative element protein (TIGR03765 family)